MASVRIQAFGGLLPELAPALKPSTNAQIAHNCLLSDGTLRPQAKWREVKAQIELQSPLIQSIAYDPVSREVFFYSGYDAVQLRGQPFAERTVVAAGSAESTPQLASRLVRYTTGDTYGEVEAGVYAGAGGATFAWGRDNDSIKPVNRMYGLTRVAKYGNRIEESSLVLLPGQDPSAVRYEGDTVTIVITPYMAPDEATHMRLYRSVSGLDTGQTPANQLDTEWHLVSEFQLTLTTYIDGASATALPFDYMYSAGFHPIQLPVRYVGMTEGGWFVAASMTGEVAVSERFMHHAWPIENYIGNFEAIRDMVTHGDNVYFGTEGRPYILSLAMGENGLQSDLRPFGENLPCLPGSMARSASGAIYASGEGIVALGRDGQQVLTRELVNAGAVLYDKEITGGRATAKISNTSYGAYFAGRYYGFCEGPPQDDAMYLTSTLYPLEVRDSMTSMFAARSGRIFSTIYETMTSAFGILSVELRNQLSRYTWPPDFDGGNPAAPTPAGKHMQSTFKVVSALLRDILRLYVARPEAVSSTAILSGGMMKDALIVQNQRGDAVGTNATLTGGSMS